MSSEIEKVQVSDVTCDQVEESWELAAQEIARIDERAEIAIQVVTQSVRTQAAVAKGRVILEVCEKYEHSPDFEGSFSAFARRLGTNAATVIGWVNAARSVNDFSDVFGDEYMLSLSANTLHKLQSLPSKVQSALLEDATDSGKKLLMRDIKKAADDPTVKLMVASKKLQEKKEYVDAAEELLAEQRELGHNKENYDEYRRLYDNTQKIKKTIKTLNEKIITLNAELKAEKTQAEESKKAQEQAQEELDKLKFDDEISVGLMVKRTGYNLQNMVPQVLSDVQRFNATKGRFPEELRLHLETMIQQLTTYLNETYA